MLLLLLLQLLMQFFSHQSACHSADHKLKSTTLPGSEANQLNFYLLPFATATLMTVEQKIKHNKVELKCNSNSWFSLGLLD